MASGLSRHRAALAKMRGTVEAGFMNGATYDDGTTVAEAMERNEFGDVNVPARPFMRAALSEVQQEIKSISKDAFSAGDSGKEKIGTAMKTAIQSQILDGNFVPNAPLTVEKKGFNHPLIETGLAYDSVEYKAS